jgi:hypothetical protein
MKKYFIFIVALMSFNFIYTQSTINLSDYKVSKLYINGLTDDNRSDYLARAVEKLNLATFAAFSSEESYGYVIYTGSQNIENIIDYINHALTGYEVTKNEEMPLTRELYLQIYSLRNNVKAEDIDKQMPKYIQLGPKNELSRQLYDMAKQIWIEMYPEAYDRIKKD